MPNPKTEIVPDQQTLANEINLKYVSVSKVSNFAGLIRELMFGLKRDALRARLKVYGYNQGVVD